MEWLDWRCCYDDSWKGLIVDEAFTHPAKAARGLVRRIFTHMESQSWLAPRSRVLDVFGGIGTTAIEGASRGHEVVCIELEERFQKLALQNFALHQLVWESSGDPLPVILHGDSRKAVDLVRGHFAACLGSPPFGDQATQSGSDTPTRLGKNGSKTRGGNTAFEYGQTSGQIGNLPEGDIDAVIGSPPYEGSLDSSPNEKMTKCITEKRSFHQYSGSVDNIGNVVGETFWLASRTILEQVHQLLRPGAVSAWIVKDYVKKGERVKFCDNWTKMCEAVGFKVVQRARCWLVKEETHKGLFGNVTKKTERKSFFRRLHERKPGAVKIDWEEVIFYQKSM